MKRARAKPVPLPEEHFARLAEIRRRNNEAGRKRDELDKQTMTENEVSAYSAERASIRDAEWAEIVRRRTAQQQK